MELKERCVDEFKVQFGETDPIDVDRINEMTYKGTVPGKLINNVKAVLKSFATVLEIYFLNSVNGKCVTY